MKSLWKDERGIISGSINVVIAVSVICVFWILMNEMVFRLGSVAIDMAAGTSGVNVMGFALSCWRLFPFILIIGTFIYVLLRATRQEGYTYPTG